MCARGGRRDHQWRIHRRHLCGSLRYEGNPHCHHRGQPDLGKACGQRRLRLCHFGHRLRLRGGHRTRAVSGGNTRRRPGVAGLLFAVSTKELAKQLERRVGQCVLTCPTTAVFAGCEGEESLPLGKNLRYFGDGWQMSKLIAGRRYWRIPVMDGEFLAEETTGLMRSVGGGNFLVLARSRSRALAACEAAVDAILRVPGAIAPFPGGVVRSGSKVGSKYKALPASTNDAFCPTLRGVALTELSPGVDAVLEIVIDAVTDADMRVAMKAGMDAVCGIGAVGGIVRLSAGNYGGKLGQFHYRLREILA